MTDQPVCPFCGMPVDLDNDIYEMRLDGSICHELCLKSENRCRDILNHEDMENRIFEDESLDDEPDVDPETDDTEDEDTEDLSEPESEPEPVPEPQEEPVEESEEGPTEEESEEPDEEPTVTDLTTDEGTEVVAEPVPEPVPEPQETPKDEDMTVRAKRFGRKAYKKADEKLEERMADPDSFTESLRRWWKLHHGYVILRTLSRDDKTGDFLLDVDICKKNELPRGAVKCTNERNVWCIDTIKTSKWYLESRYNPHVSFYEAQFKASDAALYMESNIIDNALQIKWTDLSHVDWKKIILPVAAAVCIIIFFVMRGGI